MDPDRDEPQGMDVSPAGEEWENWDAGASEDHYSLADLVNRVLDRGVVITGDVTLSVAGVDLVYLGLNVVLTSVSTMRAALLREWLHPRPLPQGGAGGG
jgi:hypothetical protein